MAKEIAIVGDFHNSKTQCAISDSIEHSNKALGIETTYKWIETASLDNDDYSELLKKFSGIWSASGSPFKSLEGSLNAIKYARENNIPHIGTCGGFQHSIVEYARNALGFKGAQHAEYSPESKNLFIDKMSCSLAGTRGKVTIKENTIACRIFTTNEIDVDYYCSYGLSDKYSSLILNGDLVVSGTDVNGTIRMMELKNHPFFIITAFVPQVDSAYNRPNRLITEFISIINKQNGTKI